MLHAYYALKNITIRAFSLISTGVSKYECMKPVLTSLSLLPRASIGGGRGGGDFAFPDTHFVKALLAMLSALRLVAGSKHAPRAFDCVTWQAGASSDRGIHKTNQYAGKVN